MKAFDTADITTGHAHDIQALGYGAVGIYLRADRAPLAMITGLRSVGLKIFSIWEKGHPTSVDYFTAAQGKADGEAAAAYAKTIGQPAGTQIYACVDYDANWDSEGHAITAYFEAFHTAVKSHGFLSSVYGSGTVCEKLVNLGFAHFGYLAQSTGFSGYQSYKPKAAIVQGPTATVLHFDVDTDTIVNMAAVW
jgi:hypothetical protein